MSVALVTARDDRQVICGDRMRLLSRDRARKAITEHWIRLGSACFVAGPGQDTSDPPVYCHGSKRPDP